MLRSIAVTTSIAVACSAALAAPASAWGSLGHRLISRVAIEALPPSVPAFVRDGAAVTEISALGPEADRLKGSGVTWDADNDHGHFVDIGDDGRIAGAVTLDTLPGTREAYDTLLRAGGSDEYKAGYLPYEIIDGYEQVVTDFAYWRADDTGARNGASDADKRYFLAARELREALTLRDIGYWSHFVADASQPLHVSVHYNGWGPYPNPNGYSDSHTIHARFETALVKAVATDASVGALLPRYVAAGLDAPVAPRIAAYLRSSLAVVPQVYALEAAGGIDAVSPAAVTFVNARLAAGAAMLRDLIADAWTASDARKVGYPPVPVIDIENGKIVLTSAFGGD